jgi:MoaA/NifB/PqqE/SkfB family radical SAM enzyme
VIEFYSTGGRGRDNILVDAGSVVTPNSGRYETLDFIVSAEKINLEERRLHIPYNVYYLPTLFCPQRCVYCYANTCEEPESDALPLARLKEIFSELSDHGVEVIQMSGGEVFARRDILDIIEAILVAGMVPDILTKFGLTRYTTDRLKELGIQTIQFSLDTVKAELLDRLIGLPGYHKRAFSAMENLRASGIEVRVNSVIMPENIASVGHLLDYLGELGNVNRVTLTPYGRSLFRHQDKLFVAESDWIQLEELVAHKLDRFPHMAVSVGGTPPPGRRPRRTTPQMGKAGLLLSEPGWLHYPS